MNVEYFNPAIRQLREIADRQGLEIINEACDRIEAVRDNFEMKVLFVGHFSAGKSSFLNELIGIPDYLKEGEDPTTSKICELRYAEIKQPNLQPLANYTIVDTPGFDSTIGEHTKALSAYLGCGGGYVIMSDVRNGDINAVTLNYIKEVATYTKNIAIVFSWCDQMAKENVDDVIKRAKDTLATWGYDFPVLGMSRHDKDLVQRLTNVILSFDIQETFNRRMLIAFASEKDALKSALQLALRHADGGTWNADNQLNNLRLARDRVKETFEFEKGSAEKKFPEDVDSVMTDIRAALEERADLCADIIIAQDAQALEAVMLEAVRPVILRHVQQIATKQVDSIVQSLNFSSALKKDDQKNVEQALLSTVSSVKTLIEAGTLGQALSVLQKEDDAKKKKSDESNKAYKAVTGITALLTDVINPWAEVVIVLLPEIVGLCKALFGASEHEVARDKYLKRIVNVVSAKLYLPVENALRGASVALVDGLSAECSERLLKYEDEIAQLENSREKSLEDNSNRRHSLLLDIKAIDQMNFLEA